MPESDAENDSAEPATLPRLDGFDPNPLRGRVAHTYGGTIDQPLSIRDRGEGHKGDGEPGDQYFTSDVPVSGQGGRYVVRFIPESANPHPVDENIDVEVVFDSGASYVATFFTLENIRGLMEKDRRTGECLGGLYLWASDMIIVERLTMDAVARTVADLLAVGEFESAFSGPHRPEPIQQ